MKNTTLKDTLIEAAEFYEHRAAVLWGRMLRATEGGEALREMRDSYEFNNGAAKAMREALEYVGQFIG